MPAWKGVSAYPLLAPDYPVRKLLRCYPNSISHPAVAVLAGTWGWRPRNLKTWCDHWGELGKKHLVELHISNECSRRTGRLGDQIMTGLSTTQYEKALCSGGAMAAIDSRMAQVKTLLEKATNEYTTVWISSGLEIGVDSELALTVLHTRIKKSRIAKKVVYSPVYWPNGYHGADLIEAHAQGCLTPPYGGEVWNGDGCSIDFGDGENFFSRINMDGVRSIMFGYRKAIFLWSASHQGLRGATEWGTIPYDGRSWIFSDPSIAGMRQLLLELEEGKR